MDKRRFGNFLEKLLHVLMLFFFIAISGCKNPLDENAVGSSTIEDAFNALLQKPGSFVFSNYNVQSSQVTIRWTNSDRAESYQVKYGTATGSYPTTASCSSSPCLISGLTDGASYYFTVIASNAKGATSVSSELNLIPGTLSNFSLNIPFTAGTSSSYVFSDSNLADLSAGVLRLTPADQTDDDSSSNGFGGGTLSSVQYDSGNGYLRLNTTTNTSELDSTWTPQWNSLVGYWKLNETSGTTVADSSPLARNGTLTGSYTLGAAGKLRNAISMSTPGFAAANLGNFFSFANQSPFSVNVWFKTTLSGGGQYDNILSNRTGSSPSTFQGWVVYLQANNGKLYIERCNNSQTQMSTTNGNFNDGLWHMATMVYDGTRQLIYVDGRLEANVSDSTLLPSLSVNLTILGAGSTSFRDDLSIWSAALSASEVKLIYDRQAATYSGQISSRILNARQSQAWTSFNALTSLPFYKPLTSMSAQESSSASDGYSGLGSSLANGLVALWHLDETSGSVITDSSGNNNHGQGINLMASNDCAVTGPSVNCKGIDGVFSKAANFKASVATAQYINIPNSATLENVQENDSTYSAWFYMYAWPAGTDNTYNTDKASGVLIKSGNHFGLYINSTTISFNTWDSTNAAKGSIAFITPKRWYHAVGVLDKTGNTIKLYVDGVLKQSVSLGAGYSTKEYNQVTFKIGTGSVCTSTAAWCNPFNGIIDEAAIWNRALSDAEIKELYRRGGNRIKYQVRTCSAADCSEASKTAANNFGWQGPDGSSGSYFSEMTNATVNNFSSSLTVANNQYFQYRAILESDDTNSSCNYGSGAVSCSPELRSVSVGPNHYSTTNPYVTSKVSIGTLFQTLSNFSVAQGSAGCTGDRYSVSNDGSNFWYFNGSVWTSSYGSYAQSSSSAQINSNIASLVATMGAGTLQVRTYLNSNGTTACEIDNILVQGTKY